MSDPAHPGDGARRDDSDRWMGIPQWFIGAAGALIVATFAIVLVLVLRDDGDTIDAVDSTTSSSDVSSTTSEPESTTTTETSPSTTEASSTTSTTIDTTSTTDGTTTTVPAEFRSAVWPWFSSPTRYADPVDAARGFAESFLGFDEAVVGEFREGDSRSGEVEIRPTVDGPATTVFVRQLGPDDTWWVLGSATANIIVDEPEALCGVESPLELSGQALAFEGNVEVQVREDGIDESVVTSNVTGGGTELLPFDGSIDFEVDPSAESGALVFLTRSAEDGGPWEAVVIRVFFGPEAC